MFIAWILLFLATAPIAENESLNSSSKSSIDLGLDEVMKSLFSLTKPSEKMFHKVATNRESLLFEDLAEKVEEHFLRLRNKEMSSPYASWHFNQLQLSQIPVSTQEEKELLLFFAKQVAF